MNTTVAISTPENSKAKAIFHSVIISALCSRSILAGFALHSEIEIGLLALGVVGLLLSGRHILAIANESARGLALLGAVVGGAVGIISGIQLAEIGQQIAMLAWVSLATMFIPQLGMIGRKNS